MGVNKPKTAITKFTNNKKLSLFEKNVVLECLITLSPRFGALPQYDT